MRFKGRRVERLEESGEPLVERRRDPFKGARPPDEAPQPSFKFRVGKTLPALREMLLDPAGRENVDLTIEVPPQAPYRLCTVHRVWPPPRFRCHDDCSPVLAIPTGTSRVPVGRMNRQRHGNIPTP